jgi:hypothetical protein
VYAGGDILKNAVTKTEINSFFLNCTHLKWIEDGIFDGLVNVTVMSETFGYATNLTRLPAHCFADMTNLINVAYCFYMSAIEAFDDDLFRDCRKIQYLDYLFSGNTKVGHIGRGILPVETDQPITSTDYAFNACSNLKTLYIPASITVMGNNFARNCALLQYVEMESETPPSLSSNAFDGTNSTFVIYVPNAAVDAYKGATNWNAYAERILPVSQKPA